MATAIRALDESSSSATSVIFPIGFILLIAILGLLVLALLGCIGHSFWSRHRARRRGEDPGPLFTWESWRWSSRRYNNSNNRNFGQVQGVGAGFHDGRGREYYNVAGAVHGNDTWQGDAVALAKYS